MITPFHEDGSVDFERTARLARYLVDTGSDGLVVTGTTGESPTLTDGEKIALYQTVMDAVGERAYIIAGTGTYDTLHSVELSRRAAELGVHGLMAVTPYYNKPSQDGLRAHFETIADATDLPVLVYNIPGRTGRLIEVDTLARLAEHPNIVATKDAVQNVGFTSDTRQVVPDDFAIYSGQDSWTLPMLAVGAVGVVSVLSHLSGLKIKAMMEAFFAGDVAEAERYHRGLMPLFNAGFLEPNPSPVKAGLNELWEPVGEPRLPLLPAAGETTKALVEAVGVAEAL
jgi:4-hydroxy-tetrahydrodipicolinate synthase